MRRFQICYWGGVKPYKIVLNNLVGYQNVEQILLLISKLKNKKIPVEMPGHDYYAVCPFFNLVDHQGKYCDIPDLAVCKTCFSLNKLFKESHQSESWLKAGVQDLAQWRAMWGAFFRQTLDELIVFSESGKTLFTKAYPCLEGKIKIIPHQVPYLRKVDAQKHPQKTIAVLGSINVNKGLNIVKEMNELCKQRDLKILVVGEAKTSELLQTGHYDVQNLPDIMEKNKVDLVFIPSIWPETFSYTTAEAMSMGLPVACFNLGAPAERVLKYDKGLIVSKIDAQTALDEIERFLQKMG